MLQRAKVVVLNNNPNRFAGYALGQIIAASQGSKVCCLLQSLSPKSFCLCQLQESTGSVRVLCRLTTLSWTPVVKVAGALRLQKF